MAYSSLDDEHLNRLRQMLERDSSIKQRIESQIERDVINDYRDSYSAPIASQDSQLSELNVKISVLTSENQKLKTQYSELLKKTNLLIDAYRRLEKENKDLKKKKEKREFWNIIFSGILNSINELMKKIILWFNT